MTEYEFTVVIERDPDGRYTAVCPALQGCYTESDNLETLNEQITDAIRLHIKDRLANGEAIHQEVGTTKVRIAV
jgi:predicted RNase H-like HicB family nuclease